jgi:hypothetical protein
VSANVAPARINLDFMCGKPPKSHVLLGRTDTSVDEEVAKKLLERQHVPWRLLGESWALVAGRGETPLQAGERLPGGRRDFSIFMSRR